jgi:hypothetical protein
VSGYRRRPVLCLSLSIILSLPSLAFLLLSPCFPPSSPYVLLPETMESWSLS